LPLGLSHCLHRLAVDPRRHDYRLTRIVSLAPEISMKMPVVVVAASLAAAIVLVTSLLIVGAKDGDTVKPAAKVMVYP
jgi:hypothetical protein